MQHMMNKKILSRANAPNLGANAPKVLTLMVMLN